MSEQGLGIAQAPMHILVGTSVVSAFPVTWHYASYLSAASYFVLRTLATGIGKKRMTVAIEFLPLWERLYLPAIEVRICQNRFQNEVCQLPHFIALPFRSSVDV